ncbi:MAG: EamA family transporter [Acidilobaceae archaeon]|nr:EamA family transporter [Acidilobaceae archaeon]
MWHGFYVLLAAALWSTIGVASSFGQDVSLMALVRSIVAGAIALLVFRSLSRPSLIAGLLLGLLFSSYPLAAITAGVGAAAFLLYTAPLWSTLSALAYGERPSRYALAGALLILISATIMGYEARGGSLNPLGFLFGLLSGITYGLYISAARYYSRRGFHREVSVGAMPFTLVVTVPIGLYHLAFGMPGDLVRAGIAGAYLAVFCTLLPYWLFSMGVKYIKASTASVLASLEPVLAAVWGLLLFSEEITPMLAASYGLILIALLISSLEREESS